MICVGYAYVAWIISIISNIFSSVCYSRIHCAVPLFNKAGVIGANLVETANSAFVRTEGADGRTELEREVRKEVEGVRANAKMHK